MANLSPKHTGLPFVVWISPRAGSQDNVLVRVSRELRVTSSEWTSVAIRPDVHVVDGRHISVQDLALLRQWVDLNREVIVKYWDKVIESTADAISQLKPLE